MYTFYQNFYYQNSSSTRISKCYLTNRVVCHGVVGEEYVKRLIQRYGNKQVSWMKGTRKAYVTFRARLSRVTYARDKATKELEVLYSACYNYELGTCRENGFSSTYGANMSMP